MKWRTNGFYLSHDGDYFAATVSTMGLDQWLAFTGTGEDREQAPDYFDSAQQAMRWCEDRLAGDGRGGQHDDYDGPDDYDEAAEERQVARMEAAHEAMVYGEGGAT